jgi:hypothetical protein
MLESENLLLSALSFSALLLAGMIKFIGEKIHSAINDLTAIMNSMRQEFSVLDRRVTRTEEKIIDLQDRMNYSRRHNDELK